MQRSAELKIAIVDDSARDRAHIAELTVDILRRSDIRHSVSGYADGRGLLDAIGGGAAYDLLLLDVLMDDMDGMALAKALREQGDRTQIIFISVSEEMCRRGYLVEAARYLMKPVQREELREALLHCCDMLTKKEILLPTDKGQYRTSLADIQYAEAFERGTRFVLTDGSVDTKLKFSEVETLLRRPMFAVCHRAYVVNLALAKYITQYEFRMQSGAVVPISRHRYSEVSRQFVNYVTD